ncbi:MAG: hypothetical protein OXC11_14415, partial [Rhodospirillales bacterium]|nr:hypothetical protein [Rhodospirillales bacterium]
VWNRGPRIDGGPKMGRSARLSIVYALRLAMLLPEFGTDWFMYEPKRRRNTPAADLQRLYKLHGPHVPAGIIERMYRAFGPMVEFSDERVFAAQEFWRAFGYHPEDMSVGNLARLWEGGPAGLSDTQFDRSFDMLVRADKQKT